MKRSNPLYKLRFKPWLIIQKYLTVKIFFITLLITMAIVSVTGYFVFNLGYQALKYEIRSKLIMTASSIASLIDADKIQTIQTPSDEKKPLYQELQHLLQKIQSVNHGKLKYIYVIAKSNDSYVYILDATPNHLKDHSTVGTNFPIKNYPQAIKGFQYPTADYQPITDVEFPETISQSGYAPIRNKNGLVVGMLGIDMDVTVLNNEKNEMVAALLRGIGFAFLLSLILGISFSLHLTKPILHLTQATQHIAKGNFEKIKINRHDELGQLAKSFNAMTQEINNTQMMLKNANLDLEKKVRLRTAELREINKENQDIMDTIHESLLTINKDLTINPHFSKYTKEIFKQDPTGLTLPELLYQGNEHAAECATLSSWLNLIFENTIIEWGDLAQLQPVEELKINVRGADGSFLTKIIHIEFWPVTSNDFSSNEFSSKAEKLMVIIEDISEARKLEETIVQKEQEFQENINQIIEIIKMDRELFKEFINDCQENLSSIEPILIQLNNNPQNLDLINELFRVMHNIKGTSMIFKLGKIANQAHRIENIFVKLQNKEEKINDTLTNQIFSELDNLRNSLSETNSLYERIIQSMNFDNGRIRTHSRTIHESKIFKIQAEEFYQLENLIEQADNILSDESSHQRFIPEDINKLEFIFAKTKKHLEQMRKVPISHIFTRFHRILRDISLELNKKVKLTIEGDTILIDKTIFDKIGDPLIHLLRNSLDHGIEKPEERLRLNKPEEGTINLKIGLTKTELLITLEDDGRGIDTAKVKEKAVRQGLITSSKGALMEETELLNLIFTPGFSTNDLATNISGRGIGMDIVKNNIEKELDGTIKLTNRHYQGLRIDISIPLLKKQTNY